MPASFVVDASVAIKWFLPEVHTEEAMRLLNCGSALVVPDLVFPEVGNILWKRISRNEITLAQAEIVMQALGALPLSVHPSSPLIVSALQIAAKTQRTVYDSLYLALAVRQNVPMVTADERLYNALQQTEFISSLRLVQDMPEDI